MVAVHFFENRKLLLSQLRENIPSTGDDLKIKGRKGTVVLVNDIDEKNVHVEVALEKVVKKNLALDNAKKKRR
ncbi:MULTISPECIES: hypothetical protein [Priestia]|jgi:hypothetical protein|uniref:Uncharacterized protein n=5 Tax=Priestia TaxID=2800373 RepID=D5DYR0_PRIM1|nr:MULTISPECIES: hypothetical protein [Priestia]AVX06667.1 hypothetical protein CS527_02625 [Bacillus sp. Y-01]KOP72873.1 preprotein translocase subunit SecA [Bacillus sp. FJAT-21351]KQU24813.1 preprotein translocase subunit SecA [Bacillus sp. Leaf75]KRD82029.1 preprotein translocase subunit SecA [Bacillus sp. Root147]KRE09459.1 preprotein translocase subunit SecA [Bacillus sp. Root239]KRF52294.1 preprotein translocase subunit SecA [Bacillus sp. Soil531]MBZ5482315.1 hypothetical protein [Bac